MLAEKWNYGNIKQGIALTTTAHEQSRKTQTHSVAIAATGPTTAGTVGTTRTTTATRPSALTAEAATAPRGATRFLRTRFIHRQRTAFNALAIEGGNRRLRRLFRLHLDKAETFRALRLTVRDHLRRCHDAVLGKHLLQIAFLDVVTQIAYI
jgi:hypothetical protein